MVRWMNWNKQSLTGVAYQLSPVFLWVCLMMLSACEAAAVQVIPTDPPTQTPTFTPSPTFTPARDVTPTRQPTRVARAGDPTETPLFGASRTPANRSNLLVTPTRPFNPNAPRIEFFTSDPLSVNPGDIVTLFWSARGIDNAVIYRLEPDGSRAEVYNVGPDGSLPIDTNASERGELRFLLAIGQGIDYQEEILAVPLACPVEWFFSPSPSDCPDTAPIESLIVDQPMERGRMVYIRETDTIYALFNDGQIPAWSSFENDYDPEIHPVREENAPPEFIQPIAELGYVWRTDNDVRNRLGLGVIEGIEVNGFIQRASTGSNNRSTLYISGADGVVIEVPPGNDSWQVIGAPR